MSVPLTMRAIAGLLAAALCAGTAERAWGQCVSSPSLVCCKDLGGPTGHRVYLTGSTALNNLMNTVGFSLAASSAPIYLVYQKGRGSCDGVHAMIDRPPAPLAGDAFYYDSTVSPQPSTCSIDQADGITGDVGLSDVFQDSCADFSDMHALPPDLADFSGPNQVMTFVVPAASSQRVISRAAAYLIYGFGGASHPVSPWTDVTTLFQRTAASGTQSMIAKAIGVPPERWRGTGVLKLDGTAGGSQEMVTTITAQNSRALTAETTIGILGADYADGARNQLQILAYQHTNQTCAYWPDSTPTSFDKVNVRDGHYPIWGPAHMLISAGADGHPTNADVATLTTYLAPEGPSIESLNAQIDALVVPQCAMKVKRVAEIGPYSPYRPSKPCGCYFEKRKGGGSGCVACSEAAPCGSGQICSYGYCEAT